MNSDEILSVSGIEVLTLLVRRRLAILVTTSVCVVLALIFWVLMFGFVAKSTFVPVGSAQSTSRLAGLAASFGIDLGSTGGPASPQFYTALLASRELLKETVLSKYKVTTHGGRDTTEANLAEIYQKFGNVLDRFESRGSDPDQRVNRSTGWLALQVVATADLSSGLIAIEAEAFDRDLSVQINRRMFELLNEFNLRTLQSQAAEQARFSDSRMKDTQRELELAERDLQQFLEHNRSVAGDPRLIFEQARLQRRVDLRQQIVTSLAQAYEQARISEVRDTPVITLVDPPELSVNQRLKWYFVLGIGAFLGLVMGTGLAFVLEYLARQRRLRPEEYVEFQRGLTAAKGTLLLAKFWKPAPERKA